MKIFGFREKTKKIPGKRFALPGMAFLPVPIPALAAGRRAVVTICKKTMRLYPMGRNDIRGCARSGGYLTGEKRIWTLQLGLPVGGLDGIVQ